MDCSPPGSSIHRISQARILEWVTKPSSRGSFWPRDRTQVSCIVGGFFNQQSHLGNSRILEWVVYPFSSGSFWLRNQTAVSCIAHVFFTNWAIREAHIINKLYKFHTSCKSNLLVLLFYSSFSYFLSRFVWPWKICTKILYYNCMFTTLC